MRLMAMLALVGCATPGDPSRPFCEDLGCVKPLCNDKGACTCDDEMCVADKPHYCIAEQEHGSCEAMLGRGWIDYACNVDWSNPPDATCLTANDLGVDWIGVRCCKPQL